MSIYFSIFLCLARFLGPEEEAAEAGEGDDGGDEVAEPTPFKRQMETFRRNEYVTAADHRHEQCRNKGDEIAEFEIGDLRLDIGRFLIEPDSTRPQRERS